MAAVLLAGSAALTAAPTFATLTEAATFDEKVANASAIIVGKVVRQESKYDADRRWILTYTTFRVEKALKGGSAQEVTIVIPGGQIGDVHQDTVGVPSFQQGDERVVFVRNSKAGPTVLYLDQGAYELRAAERGERMVIPVETDAVQIDTQAGKAVAPEEPVTLRQFEGKIQSAERRIRIQQMELLRKQQEEQSSLWNTMAQNKLLIGLALVGLAFATWQFLRR